MMTFFPWRFWQTIVIGASILLRAAPLLGQDCQSAIMIELKNSRGGFFQDQKIILTSKVDGKTYTQNSNAQGQATIMVPCGEMYDLTVSNYPKKVELESPQENGKAKSTLSYQPDMIEQQKRAAMNSAEQVAVDEVFKSLPDTTFMKTSIMDPPAKLPDYYAMTIINIRDLANAPLENETIRITGRKRGKTIKGTTDKNGRLIVYLPKGDIYDLNFKHNKNFHSTESPYSKGSSSIKLGFSYLGTKEIEKRIKEEKERILAEEKRLKAEKEAFESNCKKLGLTLEECYRRERDRSILERMNGISDTVINNVMARNKWTDKLIVCDVTGSMDPYGAQLLLWYRLNYLTEKNLQFVFFNDGDNMDDNKKKIGETGGIYYSPSKGIDSLDHFMSNVQAHGWGGELPENNMEALIKGVKMAAPFKELVMIADNRSPIRDIKLLSSFNIPVHIILCGVHDGLILPDYLKVAWKTKGTIHTMEEDITTLARLSEGQQITIGGFVYRIMGGEFVEVRKPN